MNLTGSISLYFTLSFRSQSFKIEGYFSNGYVISKKMTLLIISDLFFLELGNIL